MSEALSDCWHSEDLAFPSPLLAHTLTYTHAVVPPPILSRHGELCTCRALNCTELLRVSAEHPGCRRFVCQDA